MEKLSRPLDKILRKWGLGRNVKERMALYAWPEAAGSKLSQFTRAVHVKEGILFVQVANSSWAQHLTFFKPTLIKKLNRLLKGNIVTDIHFQVGMVQRKEAAPLKAKESNIILDELEKEKVREMFADFQGEDIIKDKLMQLMEKELLSRKEKEAKGWHTCPQCGTFAPPGSSICPLCQI